MSKTLFLTLPKQPFEVMVTGEKRREYRKPSKWILSRLDGKNDYDLVRFTNGYGNDKPYFICKFNGWGFSGKSITKGYSNGLTVQVEIGDVMIFLGEIIEVGNLNNTNTQTKDDR